MARSACPDAQQPASPDVLVSLCSLARNVFAYSSCSTLTLTHQSGFASLLLAGAVCSSAASTDLRGGRWVTIVPTATASGTVTATLNDTPFFNYAGSFTAAVSFLQSRGVAVTLRPGLNFISVSGSAGSCSASNSMTMMYEPLSDLGKNKGAPDDGLSCEPSNKQGHPINAAIGNKYQHEEDIRGVGAFRGSPGILSKIAKTHLTIC